MTIAEVPMEARAAVRARRRKEIDELDYRRELRRLDESGYSQSQISRWLGIAQPSVLSALRTAAKVTMPVEGFSGATPYEICQRYAGGLIGRDQLVDELTRFPYVKGGETDGYDSLIVDPAGTWSEVDDAVRRGLIEDDVYEEVFNRRHGITEPVVELQATPRKTSVKELARNAARDIATVVGGGEVTEKNGRFVIRTKGGLEVVVERQGRLGQPGKLAAGQVSRAGRMPAGKSVARAGAHSRDRRGV